MFKRKRELGEEAQEALKYYRKKPDSLRWIALDAFQIWYPKGYWLEDGTVGIDTTVIEFQVKEVK